MTDNKNPEAEYFHEEYSNLSHRYADRHRELRHWLVTLYNATGGNMIVGMNPEQEGVAP